MIKYTVTLFESFTPELKGLWDKLEKESGWSPFQNFSWLSNWYNQIGKYTNVIPKIVIVEYQNDVVLILPFSIKNKFNIKILEWMGGIYSDYKGPIINFKYSDVLQDFNTFWKNITDIIGQFDIINFNRQPLKLNNFYNPFYLHFRNIHDIYSYKMNIKNVTWESLYNYKIKKKQQADSNRQLKRLKSLGEIKFSVANDVEFASNIIDKMIEFKRIKYQESNTYDFLKNEKNRNFFNKLPLILDKDLNIHYSAITLNDEIISTHVGIKWNKNFYYLMPANENIRYRSYSTGRLLLEYLVKNSIEDGIEYFDFTIGSEEYKKNWCDIENQLFQHISYYSLKGYLYYNYISLKNVIIKNKQLKSLIKNFIKFIRNGFNF
jgi:CelD/BcsL family acetyltransferase involved in cellulose biosynthesis